MKNQQRKNYTYRLIRSICISIFICLLIAQSVFSAEPDSLLKLKAMSLENLMQLTVFSASKKPEQLSNVAAAMHVITREDIRRSGARTLPDLLRGVPGLSVANMDAHTWAITSRGFNGLFANKLLVLMDGRTLYTPLYSGVYWDMQDTLLNDIERIEIIRGPGATIWGANAVNGVINIITRKAKNTDGLFASTGSGSLDKTSLNARYGKAGEQISYRIYAKHLERDNFKSHEDGEHPDSWQNEKGGFRLDLAVDDDNQISIQGDIYRGTSDQLTTLGSGITFESEVRLSGGSLQLQWERQLSEDSAWSVQTSIDRSLRDDWFLDQSRTTWDISFNHRFSFLENQDIIWGGGYRYTTDHTTGGAYSAMDPAAQTTEIMNLFIQDDWTLIADKLHLILGSKIEHNDYNGYEVQPTARLLWTLNNQHSLWAAISRAVRTPSRADSDLYATIAQVETTETINTPYGPMIAPATITMNVSGNPDFKSEKLIAYEIGHRTQVHKDFSIDTTLFYNVYKDLRTQDTGIPVVDPSVLPVDINMPMAIGNNMDGETLGIELAVTWQVNQRWRLAGSYSWLKIFLHHNAVGGDLMGENAEDETPEHQASLRSYLDLPNDLEWDTSLFYFNGFYRVPAHLRCDMRLGWHPSPNWEFSVKVENLFDDSHREFFNSLGLITSDVPRNWYAEVQYHF